LKVKTGLSPSLQRILKITMKKLKFCPRCGSAKVYWASGLPQLWSIWECKECGYRGALVIEDSESAAKIRERYLKSVEKEKATRR